MELINVLMMTLAVQLGTAHPYGDISSPATLDIKIQYCGPRLTKILSSVCKLTGFASPPWDRDDATKRDRVRRDTGIVEECCKQGCSWRHLSLYCVGGVGDERLAAETSADSAHVIADRSAESGGVVPASGARSEAAGGAKGGAASGAPGEVQYSDVQRSAPILGTVSPDLVSPNAPHTGHPAQYAQGDFLPL